MMRLNYLLRAGLRHSLRIKTGCVRLNKVIVTNQFTIRMQVFRYRDRVDQESQSETEEALKESFENRNGGG